MPSSLRRLFTKPHLRLISLVGIIVPRRLRADWHQEWEAELRYREALLEDWDRLDWRRKVDLLRRSLSAFWDALWLQSYRWEDQLVQDLRYGLRTLIKHKAFTATAILSLALGIGANSAIFSLIDTLLLKSLPVKDPQQLVLFSIARPSGSDVTFSFSMFERFNQQNAPVDGILASSTGNSMRVSVAEPGSDKQIEWINAEQVSGNYFSVLGLTAVAGRLLAEEDDRASGAQPAVVISHDFWRRRFGADPSVVGREITLVGAPFTIIGVGPMGFSGIEVGGRTDLWWPIRMTPTVYPERKWPSWLLLIGRLRPGVSVEQARSQMDVVLQQRLNEIPAERLAQFTPSERSSYFERRVELEPAGTGWTPLRKQFTQPLLILMAIVGLVLLSACANVANLLLSRAAAREREIALRMALGAGRFRLIRQLLTESVILALAGGSLGLLFAYQGAQLLINYVPQDRPVLLELTPDSRVLGFTLAVSLLSGILFGLAPVMRATSHDLVTSMKAKVGAVHTSRPRLVPNKALIVVQVALSLFLLITAGLFVRSLQMLNSIETGFDHDNVVAFTVDPGDGFGESQQTNLYRQLLSRLEAMPGTQAASVSGYVPLNRMPSAPNSVRVPGHTSLPGADTSCQVLWVGRRYFETMGMPLLRGRDFGPQEERPVDSPPNEQASRQTTQNLTSGAEPTLLAAIINQTMARDLFGDEDPLGKRFYLISGSLNPRAFETIGIVRDAKYKSLREPARRAFYVSYFQDPGAGPLTFLLRTSTSAVGSSVIEHAVNQLDPRLRVVGLKTMGDIVNESLAQERFVAQVSGFFSLFSLLLACIGLYGVMSYATTRRTSEIGIRMALGARRGDIARLVMKETMLLVAVGVSIGLGLALAVTRLVSNLLFGLSATDPLTIVMATLMLASVAAVAGWLPARRASRVDPLVALRHE